MKEKLWSTVRRISLRQLRVLSAVHRAGTLAGAAEALSVSAPAVALQLRELEATIGSTLLERGPSGFRATLAGEAVLASASRIEQELVHCLETVAAISDPEAGRVSLGIISTAKYFAPRILAAYKRKHPRASVRLLVGNRAEMIRALENGEADFAITGRPPEHLPVVSQVIGEHPHVVIAHPEHRLARRLRITLAELKEEDILLREPGSGTRLLAEQVLAQAEVAIQPGTVIGSNETIKQAVMSALGIAIISRHAVMSELAHHELVELDVEGFPIMRNWFLVRRKDKRLMPSQIALWDHICQTTQQITAPETP